MNEIPGDLRFKKSHEWVRVEADGSVTIGISDHAQDLLGDIVFVNDEGNDFIIIERKSLSDLIASIKDGRYNEQSYRLIHSSGLYRHHIVYLIEGGFAQLTNPSEKKMVYSAMTSLQFFKGFSLIKTTHRIETSG